MSGAGNPCFKCENHSEICHAVCEIYNEWQKKHREEQESIHKKKMRANLIECYKKQTVSKAMRKKGK